MQKETVTVICCHFDVNEDGSIELNDFVRGFQLAERSIRSQSLEGNWKQNRARLHVQPGNLANHIVPWYHVSTARNLFFAEDHEHSMKKLEVKANLSKEDIQTFMTWMDVSEDGMVDFQEFQSAFRRARRAHARRASVSGHWPRPCTTARQLDDRKQLERPGMVRNDGRRR